MSLPRFEYFRVIPYEHTMETFKAITVPTVLYEIFQRLAVFPAFGLCHCVKNVCSHLKQAWARALVNNPSESGHRIDGKGDFLVTGKLLVVSVSPTGCHGPTEKRGTGYQYIDFPQ